MESRAEYLLRLEHAIAQLHGCSARHIESVRVREVFRGQIVWHGTVEVFSLEGHENARRAFAWSHMDGQYDSDARCVCYLEGPAIDCPAAAVRASLKGRVDDLE